MFSRLFVIGVMVQVFLAGMVVVARVATWENHISVGHGLALPLLLMLISMYVARMPRSVKRMTWVLFGVYVFQADFVIFLCDSVPFASALHPDLALVDFALGWSLARRETRWRLHHRVRPGETGGLIPLLGGRVGLGRTRAGKQAH